MAKIMKYVVMLVSLVILLVSLVGFGVLTQITYNANITPTTNDNVQMTTTVNKNLLIVVKIAVVLIWLHIAYCAMHMMKMRKLM